MRPLVTAIADPETFDGAQADLGFARTAATGAHSVRLFINWSLVAPATRPDGFQPDNPADPAYNWGAIDRQVTLAVAHGLQPIISIFAAPSWTQNRHDDQRGWGNWAIDPAAFGQFARAAATRYGGSFGGLPRVRYWQAWNEPNLSSYLNPQTGFAAPVPGDPLTPFDPNKPLSPPIYRVLLNAFADAVHGVHADNLVVVGGLAPFTAWGPRGISLGPLRFMSLLLCMSPGRDPQATCADRTSFDVWAMHPYTSGDPSHQALSPDDVSLGDLPEMTRLLMAAQSAGHIASAAPVQFWVTEFGWDSRPPDPNGVPIGLLARWVSESLYRMWSADVSLVTWFQLRDAAVPPGGDDATTYQSGLYYNGGVGIESDRPKLSLTAFRFPFVAFKNGRRAKVWGRTPESTPYGIVIERGNAKGNRWRALGVLTADEHGMFTANLKLGQGGQYIRARLIGTKTTSLPFSLVVPPDYPVNPFGGPNERG